MKEKIQEIINSEIEKGYLSGASICVVKDGETIYRDVFGYADLEEKREMKDNTMFRIYSMTKPVTAVSTLMLVERGELSLEDPVSKFLNGFANQKVVCKDGFEPVQREATIRDLLNMTSGLVYPCETIAGEYTGRAFEDVIKKYMQNEDTNTIDFCNELGKLPLEFQPGKQWGYGTSADILGAIIEIVSGKKLSEFFKDEIFIPLEMNDTDFYATEENWDRLATIYQYVEKEDKLITYEGNNLAILNARKKPVFESGGAGLVSTIDDYLKFDKMLINGGIYNGKRILEEKTVQFMRTNQLSEEQLLTMTGDINHRGYGYSNLVRMLVNKEISITNGKSGEFGWGGWAGTDSIIDPENNMIILYFIQRIDKIDDTEKKVLKSIYEMVNL